AIRNENGDDDIRVACIGPAGENRVRIAAVMNSVYHAGARGGPGAVMGSKKLKAIAARGTKGFEPKDAKKLRDVALEATQALARDKGAQALHEFGTAGLVEAINALHAFPAYNFKTGHSDGIRPLTGQALVEDGYLKRRIGCYGCAISCHRYSTVDKGPLAGTYTGGPEYENFGALGVGPGVFETDTVIAANRLCNTMGLDTISAGSVIQWAMESYERGVLTKEDTDGLEVKFGRSDVLLELIDRVAHRQGKLGNLLAEGVKRAAAKVGRDSWKWAVCNSKGLEQSRVETRSAKSYALAFAVNPRGPDHLMSQTIAEFGASPEAIELIEKLTGDKKWATPYATEYRPEIVRWHEDCYAITDALGFCSFATTLAYGVSPKRMAEMFTAVTGFDIDEETIMLAGRRIVTLERCFNLREGADRKLDDLPYRLMNEPAATGPAKGFMNTPAELNPMLDKYYSLHEWDVETGRPYRKTVQKLGLSDVAEELKEKLPS
ncbi:MAG: aldehyde ferredoxin oxidoreductase family protein, partial [Candidatus Bathyarchaeia archaeon]